MLAGYELDPRLLRERAGRLAIGGWAFSAVIAVGAVAVLGAPARDAEGTVIAVVRGNEVLAASDPGPRH